MVPTRFRPRRLALTIRSSSSRSGFAEGGDGMLCIGLAQPFVCLHIDIENNTTLKTRSTIRAGQDRLLVQRTESPPPMMVMEPFEVSPARQSATAKVPVENLSNSNTPIGPFHT